MKVNATATVDNRKKRKFIVARFQMPTDVVDISSVESEKELKREKSEEESP